MVGLNDNAIVKGNVVSQVTTGIQIGSGSNIQIVSNRVTGAANGIILPNGTTPGAPTA